MSDSYVGSDKTITGKLKVIQLTRAALEGRDARTQAKIQQWQESDDDKSKGECRVVQLYPSSQRMPAYLKTQVHSSFPVLFRSTLHLARRCNIDICSFLTECRPRTYGSACNVQ